MATKVSAQTAQQYLREKLSGEELTLVELAAIAVNPEFSHVADQITLKMADMYLRGSFTGTAELCSFGKTQKDRELNGRIVAKLKELGKSQSGDLYKQLGQPGPSISAFYQRVHTLKKAGVLKNVDGYSDMYQVAE